ncbi:uncharacterized protein LOC122025580 [Zingiber officinale]|uniref:uncharacterized protein LOC122025580 n=1 Tax=Zingiber officinale TaxID=94328 RepID=UPI001C4B0DDA|nr:uncharacterized protein LOC122025580 [Zingiber officinale]XP_042440344.1 uncharacterized protein LOC122025580 [Zingiber officinale]XP_042440345.1 uncharacterized protein LOC122025580 [Zingiber officinale]XP_042440346.1 uncharacterized protein LOC122025580 [Zingiber officinale]
MHPWYSIDEVGGTSGTFIYFRILNSMPVGEFAGEMQSYIDILVREKISITYKSWKQLTYNIDPTWRKGCLHSTNNKWRQYKAFLTQKFVFSKLDKPDELKDPPIGYGISQDDWSSFVITRMSADFRYRVSDEQKNRRRQNVYPHRLSRKGYACFADEIASDLCDDDINRAIIWKRGRANKEGEFEGDDLKITAKKIFMKTIYSNEEIDEVQSEWADCVLDYIHY